MRLNEIPETTVDQLLESYDGLLLDAYGVLLSSAGPLPGAPALIERLNRDQTPYLILSNDASRTPATSAARYASIGLDIPEAHVLTTGILLPPWFAREGLRGARCVVLGPPDSKVLVERAGGEVIDPAPDADATVVVLADEAGYPFVQTVDTVLTMALRRLRAGHPLRLVLPNPDLIYVRGEHEVGFTAGSIALMIEAALQRVLGPEAPRFAPLGKPHPPLFEEALRRMGLGRVVMLGDQLETDIAGARQVGLDAVLLGTGLTDLDEDRELPEDRAPRFRLRGLDRKKL